MQGAFQPSAFQNTAFQVGVVTTDTGGVGRRRRRTKDAWYGPMVRDEATPAEATEVKPVDEAIFLLGLTDEGLVFGVM